MSSRKILFLVLIPFLVISLSSSAEQPVKPLKEALFYEKLPQERIKCQLCPWGCTTKPGERGICRIRENQSGKLFTLSYGRPCTINVDPIEKKPFYHFLPGVTAFSLATGGCNLACKFCQNWQISQKAPEELQNLDIPSEGIIELTKKAQSKVIAFTYSEPIVFYEYMLEIAKLARKNKIKSVVVSNGFINPEPLKLLCQYVDAIKIDLKSFNEKYYEEVVQGRLQPVLESLKIIKAQKVHLEIVYLVIPGLNDDPAEIKKMCQWIKKNLGTDVPLHFSRFHPDYKMTNYPATPLSTVEKLREVALAEGLHYVYLGNVPPGHPGEDTYCPKCGKVLIKRKGYEILENHLQKGKCPFDGTAISGVWF